MKEKRRKGDSTLRALFDCHLKVEVKLKFYVK